jgi:cyanate permease
LMIVYCFGAASVATILGAAGVITWSVNALGPMLAGLMYDLTGTYGPVFLGFAAADVVAAVVIFFYGHPPRQEAPQVLCEAAEAVAIDSPVADGNGSIAS